MILGEVAQYIRSKNAGPFWVTIDIFFPDPQTFSRVRDKNWINKDVVQKLMGVSAAEVEIYYCENIHVIKVSYPRGVSQGGAQDRDVHAGQQFIPLYNLDIPDDC